MEWKSWTSKAFSPLRRIPPRLLRQKLMQHLLQGVMQTLKQRALHPLLMKQKGMSHLLLKLRVLKVANQQRQPDLFAPRCSVHLSVGFSG